MHINLPTVVHIICNVLVQFLDNIHNDIGSLIYARLQLKENSHGWLLAKDGGTE
eukprot:IDg18448t1